MTILTTDISLIGVSTVQFVWLYLHLLKSNEKWHINSCSFIINASAGKMMPAKNEYEQSVDLWREDRDYMNSPFIISIFLPL
jgi:hypothetical protein